MAFLGGKTEHQVDAKNRIRIPAKLHSDLGKEFFFMAGANGCIAVYPKEALEERIEKLKEIHSGDPKRLAAKRKVLASISAAVEDDQGRTLLPASLRTFAGINKSVVTVGMIDHIEIWAKERYVEEDEAIDMNEALQLVDF